MDIQQALSRLVDKDSLTMDEMAAVMRQVMSGDATEAQIGGLLVALRMKGVPVPRQWLEQPATATPLRWRR